MLKKTRSVSSQKASDDVSEELARRCSNMKELYEGLTNYGR